MAIHNCNYCQLFSAIGMLYWLWWLGEMYSDFHKVVFLWSCLGTWPMGLVKRISKKYVLNHCCNTWNTTTLRQWYRWFVNRSFLLVSHIGSKRYLVRTDDPWVRIDEHIGSDGCYFVDVLLPFFHLYSVAVSGCKKTMMNYLEESCNSSQNMGMLIDIGKTHARYRPVGFL